MTLHVPRVPFSLDPLIAEAKRRARQRRVLAAVAVLLVGSGAGAAIVASSAPGVATARPLQSALVASVIGKPEQPGQLRLDGTRVYSPRFGIAVILRNGARPDKRTVHETKKPERQPLLPSNYINFRFSDRQSS